MKTKKRLLVLGTISLVSCCCILLFIMTWRQSRLNRELVTAVENGDVARATIALKNGADPNSRHIYQNTPHNLGDVVAWCFRSRSIFWHDCPVLTAACESSNSVPLAKVLLEHGADPNGKDIIGFNALLDCIEQDRPELVELLLAHGIKVDEQTSGGDTALMLLAHNSVSTTQSMPILIRYGANLNMRNNEGKTALQLARESKHSSAIKILEEAGAK